MLRYALHDFGMSGKGSHVYFNVIRFGQVQGWQTKQAPFVLSYPVDAQNSENMIIQKGRLAGWNSRSVKAYLERIAGR